MAACTVLSIWLPVREGDEAAIEAGATPDVFRIRVPHALEVGTNELTPLQAAVVKMARLGHTEVHLPINSANKFPKENKHLNVLAKVRVRASKRRVASPVTPSQEIGGLYNEWSEMAVDADEVEDEADEEDEEEEDEEDEEDDDDDEKEEGEITPPPAKKTKVDKSGQENIPPYVIPTVTSLRGSSALAVLAPHLNVTRPMGEPARVSPFGPKANEHFAVIFVSQDDV